MPASFDNFTILKIILFLSNSANRDHGFVDRVIRNAATYVKLFQEVIDVHMPKPSLNFREEDQTSFDVIME